MKIEFTILGRPITKKNHSQIITNRKTGRQYLIPSKQYIQYEADCVIQIPSSVRLGLDMPCMLKTVFFMPNERNVDVNNLQSSISDILVKAGVIKDDNRFISTINYAWCETDKKNPRTEITIDVIK